MTETHTPDPSLHYVLGFSGGKDSVASWLHLTRELQLPNVTCLFADTGHEFPELFDYLDLLERDHGCPLVRIHATMEDVRVFGEASARNIIQRLGLDPESYWHRERLDMQRLAILKRRFPSSKVRFCTDLLKTYPSARWMKDNCNLPRTIRVSGVRAEESPGRARQPAYSFDELTGCWIWKPVFRWTHDEVFACHYRHGVPPNPLYLEGMGRVGCAPCIMARKSELAAIAQRRPEAFIRLADMEQAAADATGNPVMTFFSVGKTPPQFCSAHCPNTGKPVPTADDVRLWALGAEPANSRQPLLFQEDWSEDAYTCSSQYGLCE